MSLHQLSAQSFVFQSEPENNHLHLKWYTQQLIYPEGVLLYRKTSNGDWEQINQQPIIPKQHIIDKETLSKDSALAEIVTIINERKNYTEPEPLLNVNFMIKSFHSLDLAKYLGVYYKDTGIQGNLSYQYKVTTVDGKDLLISDPIIPNEQIGVKIPEGIELKRKGRRVKVKWKHQQADFYAVNIYAKYPEDSAFILRNPLPIIPSESEGKTNYFSERISKQKGTYQYKIRAIDFWGELSEFSTTKKFELAQSELVEAAYGLKVDTTIRNTVRLVWKHEHPSAIFGYELYHKTKVKNEWKLFKEDIINSDQKEFTIIDLEAGDHYFSIAALNKDGDPNHSNTALAVIEDLEPPKQIIGLTASFENRTANLTWNKSTAPDLEGYLIYRSFNNIDYLLTDGDEQLETTFQESFEKQVKTSIWYKVVARDSSFNNSIYSEAIEIEIKDDYPPQVPVIKTVKTEEGQNKIYWLANVEPDLQGYILQRCVNENCQLLNNGEVYKSTFFIDSLENKEELVSYELKAIDVSGNESDFSTSFVVKNLVSSSLEQKIALKVKKKRKHYQVSWKYQNKKSKPSVLFLITDNSKKRIDQSLTTYRLDKNTENIGIKAYYKSGQVIESNHWKKE